MPGSWQQVEGGFRWTSGRWGPAAGQAQQAVLPPPPASLEQGPTSEPASDDDFWVPGTWQFRQQRYVWRPGFWSPCHENWVWVPDYYVPAVSGCYYVPGYWDYGWERRGILYAPCRFRNWAVVRPGFVYRPNVVVDVSGAFFHLWVRPSYGCYFFGDYYDDYYTGIGFCPWYRYHHFQHRAYDPLYVHYRWRCRATVWTCTRACIAATTTTANIATNVRCATSGTSLRVEGTTSAERLRAFWPVALA